MEKGNEAAAGGQTVSQADGAAGSAAAGGAPGETTTDPGTGTGTGTGTEPAPVDQPRGGGAQADQSGPDREELDTGRGEFPPSSGYPGYEVGPSSGATDTGGTTTDPGTGTGTEPAPADQPSGGGQQADQSGPDETQRKLADDLTQARQRALQTGAREETYRDGAKLRLDGQGGAEYEEGPNRAKLVGNDWVDPKTGQPVDRGVGAKADHRLRQLGGSAGTSRQ